jgi:Nucleotidyltransferase domain
MSHELYAFGSLVRGDVTPSSDVDILVVPLDFAEPHRYPPGWSVYTRRTMLEYFQDGRLFAWHLHLESRCLFSPMEVPWLATLGKPAPYKTAREDVEQLGRLLAESLSEIRHASDSLVYELGLAYTAIRDIAMSASWAVAGRPNFSRNAPFELPGPCPLDCAAYRVAMAARHASTRGTVIPDGIERAAESLTAAPLDVWVTELQRQL